MYVFIVNPHAGNGKANFIFEHLQKSTIFEQLNSKYYYSEYEGHAEEIAASLITEKNITVIIVIGGDGTIYEVMNGLGKTDIPIGFIPGGSGNDFARGVGIKGTPEEILQKVIDGKYIVNYWLGNYTRDNGKTRYFVNSIGFGFDAQTAYAANNSPYKRIFNQYKLGAGSYIIAILQILKSFKRMRVDVTLDGKKRTIEDCWLVSIGNHPYYGGGMKIMPNAKVQPEKFSVLIIHSMSKLKVLTLFMTVFTGKHVRLKGVELLEAKSLEIYSGVPIYTQVDGQTAKCTKTNITKEAKAIQIISG
ncbi:diacylglycerol/lipid kinase family protein [Oceanobacillus sp. FSL H7-0719]|uniref:diacylglycerol/lipid kinase family protein n=1 Tax=Oceanobacillus sp. FSL H7-0719 TaxID=2954507 RepID=UPI00324BEE4A